MKKEGGLNNENNKQIPLYFYILERNGLQMKQSITQSGN